MFVGTLLPSLVLVSHGYAKYIAPRDECYNITTSTTYSPYAVPTTSYTFPNTTLAEQCQVAITSLTTITVSSYVTNAYSSNSTQRSGSSNPTITSSPILSTSTTNASTLTSMNEESLLSEFVSIYSVLSVYNETLNLPLPTPSPTVPFVVSTYNATMNSNSTSGYSPTGSGASPCPSSCRTCATIVYYGTVTVSIASHLSSTAVSLASQTESLKTPPLPNTSTIATSSLPLITFGSSIYTPYSSEYIIANSTLAPGGPAITISGTMLSLGPSATQLIVSGVSPASTGGAAPAASTFYLSPAPLSSLKYMTPTSTQFTSGTPTVLLATATITGPYNLPVVVLPSDPIVIAGTTLVAGGPAVTIHETPVSLAPSSSFLVVGSSTITLARMTATATSLTSSAEIGSKIWSGMGGTESGASTTVTSSASEAVSSAAMVQANNTTLTGQVFTGFAARIPVEDSFHASLYLFLGMAIVRQML